MNTTILHNPRYRQPDDSMRIAERGSGSKAEATGGSVHEGNVKLLPWLMLTAILSGVAIGVSLISWVHSEDMYRVDHDQIVTIQNDMNRFRVQVMSHDALMLREGIEKPGDMWYGPEGNLEYGRKDKPKERK